jgi:hypothetical protein
MECFAYRADRAWLGCVSRAVSTRLHSCRAAEVAHQRSVCLLAALVLSRQVAVRRRRLGAFAVAAICGHAIVFGILGGRAIVATGATVCPAKLAHVVLDSAASRGPSARPCAQPRR